MVIAKSGRLLTMCPPSDFRQKGSCASWCCCAWPTYDNSGMLRSVGCIWQERFEIGPPKCIKVAAVHPLADVTERCTTIIECPGVCGADGRLFLGESQSSGGVGVGKCGGRSGRLHRLIESSMCMHACGSGSGSSCMCMCMCIHTCACMHVGVGVHACACMWEWTSMWACMHMTHACIHA